MPRPDCMMRPAICTASRLPRPWIGQAFTAAPPAVLRYSSNSSAADTENTSPENTSAETTVAGNTSPENTSPDDFVKQVVGIPDSPRTRGDKAKKPSSIVVRKVPSGRPPAHAEDSKKDREAATPLVRRAAVHLVKRPAIPLFKRANTYLVRREPVQSVLPWKLPARKWPEKPAKVFSRRRALTLRGLPLGTTLRDIVLAIDHAARQHQVTRRAALTADIVIKPGLDGSTDVDAIIDFMHPDGAERFRALAAQQEFKVRGVVPEVSLADPRDPSETPFAAEGDEVIAQLSKADRVEYFASPQLSKVVRRTNLIYN